MTLLQLAAALLWGSVLAEAAFHLTFGYVWGVRDILSFGITLTMAVLASLLVWMEHEDSQS